MSDTRKEPFERVIIVTRRTELEELVARFSTVPQARFYLEHSGHAFDPVQAAHDAYMRGLDTLRRTIPSEIKQHSIDRDLVPRYDFDANDLVAVIGQDGLVSNTAKYLSGQPILGVNPNPELYDGVLLPFDTRTAKAGVAAALAGRFAATSVTLAEARTSDGQSLLAFNDFFIGARSHISARYEIAHGKRHENQSSSGIIVSTGAGSTGWMRSVHAGAAGIYAALGDGAAPPPVSYTPLPWDTDNLLFAVREPFPSRATGTSLIGGRISRNHPLGVSSHMPGYGVIFSDGVEADFLAFNSGADVTISLADKKARLIVPAK